MDLRAQWIHQLKITLPTLTSSPRLHGSYLWTTSSNSSYLLGKSCIKGSSLHGMPWEFITALFERTAAKMSLSLFILLTD